MSETISIPPPEDAPRIDPWTDDALGFGPFSERLADALVRQAAPNGYVFGLHGEWGSGKSTVLNFIKAFIGRWVAEGRADASGLECFDFAPWIVAGHQDLAAAFFKVLSEKLGDGAERRRTWRGRAAGFVDSGAGTLIDAVAKMGIALDHTGGVASKAAAAVAKGALGKAAKKWRDEPSLQKSYDDLVLRLGSSGRRFVVFVDDIDRLTASEIRSLMQMVKSVGRLPNVTYCLAYDRQIVWSALRELSHGDGVRSGYAEKIVQHEVEVPVPGRAALMRMLDASMPQLPEAEGLRWIELMQAGLHRWIRHPRDAIRLGNAMRFSWAALEGEVDPHDLLCMEGLRLFDRRIFEWVRDNRLLLIQEGFPIHPRDDKEPAVVEARLRHLEEGAKADVPLLMKALFANRSGLFGSGTSYSGQPWSDVVARRGIATPAGYAAYFALAPSPAAVPKRMVDEAASGSATPDRHLALIDETIALRDEGGATLVAEYLQEVGHRLPRCGEGMLRPLLQALIERSDAIHAVNGGAGAFGPASSHHLLVGGTMDRMGPTAAGEVLEAVFAVSDAVGGMATVYVDIARSHGVIPSPSNRNRNYLPDGTLERLAAVLLPRIVRADAAGALDALPHYYDVAQAWAQIGDPQAAREFLTRQAMRSSASLAKVAVGLLSRSWDGAHTMYGMETRPDVVLYDVEALLAACGLHASSDGLDREEAARISALRSGLERWRMRLPSEPTDDGGYADDGEQSDDMPSPPIL